MSISINSGSQMSGSSVDFVSKNIQNKISDAQRKMHKLSSDTDMTEGEKTSEKQKLQKEISSLNTKLRQRKTEDDRKEKRDNAVAKDEAKKAEKSSDKVFDAVKDAEASETISSAGKNEKASETVPVENKSAKTDEKKEVSSGKDVKALENTNLTDRKMGTAVAADISVKQAGYQGMVVARTEGGVAILKAEIKQDKSRGVDVEKRQEELKKQEKRVQRAADSMYSVLGTANKSARKTARGTEKNSEDKPVIKAVNFSKDKNGDAQQVIFS